MVKGDLIVPESNVIMTRSKAKQSITISLINGTVSVLRRRPQDSRIVTLDPDQYTIIPAPLKILKLLIDELLLASGAVSAPTAAANAVSAAAAELEDDDADGDADGWEDEPDTLDLGLGSTKQDLMSYLEGGAASARQRDDETQAYLTEFFIRAAHENTAGFQDWYTMLSDDEKARLNQIAQAA